MPRVAQRMRLRALSVLLALAALFVAAGCASGPPKPTFAELLNRAVGTKTRADFIQHLGPPVQTTEVDGDEFFVYSEAVNDPLANLGSGLGSWAAGFRGQTYIPPPPALRFLILRFDGRTGLLKGWSMR